ncbi:hypothetical protein [Streptomyces misionensis]|uniref:hypothetical protein n=1 Tax=Streptomyces misionensis TaxID=67331 RepID=UPI00340A774C
MADEMAAMRELWPQVLDAVKKRRRFTWMLLSQNAQAFFYDGATLTLTLGNQGALDNFLGSNSSSVTEEALEEVLSHPVTVELVLEKTPLAPLSPTFTGPAAPGHVPAPTSVPSPQPDAPVTSTLHRMLGQTAFLMHEQGNDQAAALLADVGDVELVHSSKPGKQPDAVLIVPPYLVTRFTDEVLAAIQPVFAHVAGRHGLHVNGISAVPVLPEIGDDWRQILQARLTKRAATEQVPETHAKVSSTTLGWKDFGGEQTPGCTRYGKTTGRRCRRPAAEWPAYDDLPSPVAACASHLAPAEWEACQQARERSRKENSARVKAELAARDIHDDAPKADVYRAFTPRPCTGQCTPQARARGRDSDGALVSCANCDGWICVNCGQAKVEESFGWCADCSEHDPVCDSEPERDGQYDGETDTGPNPHAQLTALVNALVKKTAATHREVNARLNRRIGVISRVGADEQVIRRAVSVARAWLHEIGSSI